MTKALGIGLVLAAVTFASEPADETWDVIATMAAALAEPNPAAFMKPVAKSFDKYALLEREVQALVATNDVVSSISPVSNTGDDKLRSLELDWYLEIHSQGDGSKATLRRETLKVTLVKDGKRWRITALAPVEFFAAPSSSK